MYLRYDFRDKARRFNRAVQAAFKSRGLEYMRLYPESAPAIQLILDHIDETTTDGPRIIRGPIIDPLVVKAFIEAHPEIKEHMRTFLAQVEQLKGPLAAVFAEPAIG